jgi:hypothetical protein
MSEFDSPWKEALEAFLQAFLAFFFPEIHAAIDWSRGYEALDKELQQVVQDAELGRRFADKLYKVWLLTGAEAWILIHIEVQGQPEEDFAERMFVYNYRIFDRYRQTVVSLAVLTDEQDDWRPQSFHYGLAGCRTGIDFLISKLLDRRNDLAALEWGNGVASFMAPPAPQRRSGRVRGNFRDLLTLCHLRQHLSPVRPVLWEMWPKPCRAEVHPYAVANLPHLRKSPQRRPRSRLKSVVLPLLLSGHQRDGPLCHHALPDPGNQSQLLGHAGADTTNRSVFFLLALGLAPRCVCAKLAGAMQPIGSIVNH